MPGATINQVRSLEIPVGTVIIVFIIGVLLVVPLASLQCLYLGVRYWQRPMMLRPRPPIMVALGIFFAIASITMWTNLPMFKTV